MKHIIWLSGLFCASLHSQPLSCQLCHGSHLQGNEMIAAPALNILSPDYVAAQLEAFKHGLRPYPPDDQAALDMQVVASQLSEADTQAALALVRQFRSSDTAPLTNNKVPAAWSGCVACHGNQGQGNPAVLAPAIRGQLSAYLLKRIKAFKYQAGDAVVLSDSQQAMQQVMQSLSEQDMQQLSDYLAQSTPTVMEIK